MNIGIIVFAYNRSWHLKKVLDGLRKNEGISKLYVFQDGLKCEEHRDEWEKTQQVIRDIDWCETVYQLSDRNKGLACSVVDGINAVFKEKDAVIVLEDDCVPSSNFLCFMTQCFCKYQDSKEIYSVSGYAWPMDLTQDEYDIYGCGRISSWGWGTWKDRWEQYHIDNNIIKRLRKDKEKSRYLAAWGKDCEQMLFDRIVGKNDSWAIYWGLIVIENKGICINPYKSLIHNIGFDGTGVHCGDINLSGTELNSGIKKEFCLPDKLEISQTTECAFADIYGSYTAISGKNESKENVLIYGLGNFFHRYEKEINAKYNIVAFIDHGKSGWYAGKKILKLYDAKNFCYDKIIILVQSIQECIKIVGDMIQNGVEYKSIILGQSIYGRYSKDIDEINITSDGKILLKFGDAFIKVESQDEFSNVCEVFVNQEYCYFINNIRRDIVIDIGMNIGDSSIYFAQMEKVDKVYGYEPFRKMFMRAENNLRQYIDIGKVCVSQYGISNENNTKFIGFKANMSCGQSTLDTEREYVYDQYKKWGLVQEKDEQTERIEVRKASEVFESIFRRYPHHNIILKMDCEGEEYGILEELLQSGLLEKFHFIMIEWHYRGKETILSCLEKAGFSWWCSDKSREMGLVHAYQYRR